MRNISQISPNYPLPAFISSNHPPYNSQCGIYNKNNLQQPANYCYAISFLQLILHSPTVTSYLTKSTLNNFNERLLQDILTKLLSSSNPIYITDFMNQWKGWYNNTVLPDDEIDASEFANFLIKSLSDNIQNAFQMVFLENINKNLENPVITKAFMLTVLAQRKDLQKLINRFLRTLDHIQTLPQCLLINIDRNSGGRINNNLIDINMFININSISYRFVGLLCFTGKDNNGHLTTVVRIDQEYFLFDDHDCTCLSTANYAIPQLAAQAKVYSQQIHGNSVLFLYEKSDITNNTSTFINFFGPSFTVANPLQKKSKNVQKAKKKKKRNAAKKNAGGNTDQNCKSYETITSFSSYGFPNLFGKMKIIVSNSSSNENGIKDFPKLWKIFQHAGFFFNQMNFIDSSNNTRIIIEKGEEIFNIFQSINTQEPDFHIHIGTSLFSIIQWYNKEYGNFPRQHLKTIISNDLEKCDVFIPHNNDSALLTLEEFNTYMSNIINDFFHLNDVVDFNLLNDSGSDSDSDFTSEQSEILSNSENETFENKLQFSDIKNKYPNLFKLNYKFDLFRAQTYSNNYNDDNKFILEYYNWDQRITIHNINDVFADVNRRIRKASQCKSTVQPKISAIKDCICQDFLKSFDKNFSKTDTEMSFCRQYIEDNKGENPSCSWVTQLRERKNINQLVDFTSCKTLMKKIYWFKNLSDESKQKYLQEDPLSNLNENLENPIVSIQTIQCLVTLLSDFPSMTTDSYVLFINSTYGTNYDHPVKKRTLQKYMKFLDYQVENAPFNPPDINSIGLKIFRYSWCKIVKDIINQGSLILGFIDEGTFTENKSRKNGKGYIGFTPSINEKKALMTVITMIIPSFGILYRFVDKNLCVDDYAEFICDAVRFLRLHVCDTNEEIILFNDNCCIHDFEKMEKVVESLKIILVPTVPNSPSLMSVVGSFYSFMKEHLIINTNYDCHKDIKETIKKKWNDFIIEKVDLIKIKDYYEKWLKFLDDCMKGLDLSP